MLREPPLIAVVDDDEPIRKALSRLLRAWEFSVESFSSGRAFLDSLRDRHPDCVVLDLHMPDMNGLQVLRDLRCKGLDMPVIIITAHDEPNVRADCMAMGANDYLAKPIDEAVLRQTIAGVIR